MPKICGFFAATLLLVFSATAHAANVDVAFSSKLNRNMDALNSLEQKYEQFFRAFRDSYQADQVDSAAKHNTSVLYDVAWAGETLIPDIANFTVENLTKALVTESLARAGLDDLEGTIKVRIDRIKVANHSLNFLRSMDSYVIGSIEHIGTNGDVLKSAKFSANLVFDVSVDIHYAGPGFAFYSGDETLRVGPTLTRFVEKGLENLFEGRNFPHVTLIGR